MFSMKFYMETSSEETLGKVFGTKLLKGFEILIQMSILLSMIMKFYHPILQNVISRIWMMLKLISLGCRKV